MLLLWNKRRLKVNDYVSKRIKLKSLPEDLQNILSHEAETVSNLGICSDNDYRDFFYITLHAGPVAKELIGKQLNTEDLSKLSSELYKNRDKNPIHSIYHIYCAIAKALESLKIPIKKIAYPQDQIGQFIQPAHNRAKWLSAMRDIYAKAQQIGKEKAFETVTSHWEEPEKKDFKNWMAFYEQRGHMVYKT